MRELSSTFEHRIQHKRHVIKSLEAEENKNRKLSERFADFMTKHFGTMKFLCFNAIWFIVWITINLNLVPVIRPFDPFPFSLLTMLVSLEAIFLAIIVLISQNRAEKIADLREEIDLQINTISEQEITKLMQLQALTLKKLGVNLKMDEELQEMLEPADIEKIETTLKKQIIEEEKD